VDAFEKSFAWSSSIWNHCVLKSQKPIVFLIAYVLNQCQVWWALSLSPFQFVITWHFGYRPFWIQHDLGVCGIMWCLCSSKKSSSLPSWTPSTITNPCIIVVFYLWMDFIMDLSPSNSYNSTLVLLNHLTKMVHFIPCTKTIINEKQPRYFLNIFFNIMASLKIFYHMWT